MASVPFNRIGCCLASVGFGALGQLMMIFFRADADGNQKRASPVRDETCIKSFSLTISFPFAGSYSREGINTLSVRFGVGRAPVHVTLERINYSKEVSRTLLNRQKIKKRISIKTTHTEPRTFVLNRTKNVKKRATEAIICSFWLHAALRF